MNLSRLNVTQAGAVSLLVAITGLVVSLIPGLQPDQASVISTGTLVIAAVFAVIHAVHAAIELVREFLSSKQAVSLAEIEKAAKTLVQSELGKVDLNALAKDAVDGQNIGDQAKAEVQRLLKPILETLAQPGPAPVPAQAAPVEAQAVSVAPPA